MSNTSVTSTGEPPSAAREDLVDLREILLALRASLRPILLVAAVALAASVVFVTVTTPRYQGEAQILLESSDTSFTRAAPGTTDPTREVIDEQAVASQVEVIRSRDVAREAIERLGLVGNPEFDPQMRPMNPIDRLIEMTGIGRGAADADSPPADRVFETYYERLTVFAVNRSRVIAIEFRSRDPELASRAANTIAEVYLETLEAAKIDAARTASTWLASNIERLRERVGEAEARVEEFRSGTGLLVGRDNATLSTQQLDGVSVQLAEARTRQADSQARAGLIRELIDAGRAFDIPDVADDELIRGLVQDRVTLRAQIANESRTLLPRHPRLLALEAQLADLDAQIRGAAERRVRALENEARLAAARVDTLEVALGRQMEVASRANENEVQLRALEREARAEREQLEVFLARYRDALVRDSEAAALPDARVVSRATEPRDPVWPQKGPIVVLFTLGAVIVAVGVVVMKAVVFDTARPARPILTAPAAFAPPAAQAAQVAEPPSDPGPGPGPGPDGGGAPDPSPADPAEADGFDVPALAARLARIAPADRGRRIAIGALGDGAVAAALAAALAERLGRTELALIVSLDAPEGEGDPEAAPLPVGFSDLVSGEASFFEAIDRVPGGRPHRIAAGTRPLPAIEGEAEESLEIVLSAFDQTYAWTLLVGAGDAERMAAVAPRVDAVVIGARATPDDPDLVALYEAAKDAGAPDVVVAIAADWLTQAA